VLADQCAQQAGLADAVAAEYASDFAGLRLQRNAAQSLGRAVLEADVFDFEHSARPSDSSFETALAGGLRMRV
jgi:hypothetical protein